MGEFYNPDDITAKHGAKLPHWQQAETMQFVTIRLGDAMPQGKLRHWKDEVDAWRQHHPEPWTEEVRKEYHRRFTKQLEDWLDAGAGSCLLADAAARAVLEETLMRDHETRAVHHAWVIMPNHAHLLFTPQVPLEALMKSWKGVSARRIGKGSIWQRGYRDTMIRDGEHFANAVRYIRRNPRNPRNLRAGEYSVWEGERAKQVG
ncbi:MAG: transposase [Luteolibacter sp.]|jgi:putative transposase